MRTLTFMPYEPLLLGVVFNILNHLPLRRPPLGIRKQMGQPPPAQTAQLNCSIKLTEECPQIGLPKAAAQQDMALSSSSPPSSSSGSNGPLAATKEGMNSPSTVVIRALSDDHMFATRVARLNLRCFFLMFLSFVDVFSVKKSEK